MPSSRLTPCLLLPLLTVLSGCISHPPATSSNALARPASATQDGAIPADRPGAPIRATSPATAGTPARVASPAPRTDCHKAKCIALTFDDGPGPLTSGILDALEARKAHATFFVLGPRAQANPAIIQHARDLGMEIGNHSWTHADLARMGQATATRELTRTSNAIRRASGQGPFSVRPPYGSFVQATPHTGLPFVLWDVDTEDWKNHSSAVTTQRALAGAHPGAIILMHDIHPSTARALPGLLKALQGRGYTLVTVPELLGPMSAKKAYHSSTVRR